MWRTGTRGFGTTARALAWAALATIVVVGCGGTATDDTRSGGHQEGAGGSSAASGSTSSSGGSVAAAGGRANGRGGSAGTVGAGGAPLNCPDLVCPPIKCAPGYMTVQLPTQCCPTCVNGCDAVDCAVPKCKPGSVLVTPAGQCCPVCSLDCSLVDCAFPECPVGSKVVIPPGQCCGSCQATDAGAPICRPGISDYMQERIAEVKGLSCNASTDCQIVSFGGRCRLDCGTAVNVNQGGFLMKEAMAYSDANCQGCPMTDAACPPVYYTAECRSGQCVRVP